MDTEENIADHARRQAIMSPRIPELQPMQPQSAKVLTLRELHSLDGIGLSPTLSRSIPREQCIRDINSREIYSQIRGSTTVRIL
jgi:hypothetical protein